LIKIVEIWTAGKKNKKKRETKEKEKKQIFTKSSHLAKIKRFKINSGINSVIHNLVFLNVNKL